MKNIFDIDSARDTKTKIMAAALQLISEGGADSFTANNLVQRAKISKGALYHYFPSLEDVLLEALRTGPQDHQCPSEINYQSFASVGEFLKSLSQEMIEVVGSQAFLSMILFFAHKSLLHPEFRKNMTAVWESEFERMGLMLQHFYHQPIPRERLFNISGMVFMAIKEVAVHTYMHEEPERFYGIIAWLIQAIERDLEPYEHKTPAELGLA
jgi:AcrR family transcriptional regulator